MKNYHFEIIDAEDGSGDSILQFDEEFLKDNDWRAGDNLKLVVEGEALIISNEDWKSRNENLPK